MTSLLWWHVYWCEGGTTCHSHEIANNNSHSIRFNQFPMKNVNSAPTFFLVQEAFHSDTHHNREEKTIATSVHHSNNHSEHFSNCLETPWKPSKTCLWILHDHILSKSSISLFAICLCLQVIISTQLMSGDPCFKTWVLLLNAFECVIIWDATEARKNWSWVIIWPFFYLYTAIAAFLNLDLRPTETFSC